MGMALDEPKQEDTVLDRGAYKLVVDPQMAGLIQESGGLNIDFVQEPHRQGYVVALAGQGGGCDSGGCGSSGC